MTEQDLTLRLEDYRREESRRQSAGDGGVYSMDEILRELMAQYQPLPSTPADSRSVTSLVAC